MTGFSEEALPCFFFFPDPKNTSVNKTQNKIVQAHSQGTFFLHWGASRHIWKSTKCSSAFKVSSRSNLWQGRWVGPRSGWVLRSGWWMLMDGDGLSSSSTVQKSTSGNHLLGCGPHLFFGPCRAATAEFTMLTKNSCNLQNEMLSKTQMNPG